MRSRWITAAALAGALLVGGCGSGSNVAQSVPPPPTAPAVTSTAPHPLSPTPPSTPQTTPTTTSTQTTPTTARSTETTTTTTSTQTTPTTTTSTTVTSPVTISCVGGFDNRTGTYDARLAANAWYADITATNMTCAAAINVIEAYGKGTRWSLSAKYKAAGFDCATVVKQLGEQQFEGTGTCSSGAQKAGWTDPPGD